MARLCTVCNHESRVVIDRLIGTGTVTLRNLAEQFGLSTTALHRHQDHVVQAVRRSIERKTVEREEQMASVWRGRLESAYESAERGVETAANDPKQWPAGARYLAVMSKLIETGLTVDGVIGPAAQTTTTTTVEQVLILPQKQRVFHSETPAIESTCELAEDES